MSKVMKEIGELDFRLTGLEERVDQILKEKLPQINARMTRIENAGVNLDRRMTKLALRQEVR